MKRDGGAAKDGASGLIGEMMLAKTVLEEKNEALDRKEGLIRELRTRERGLESELCALNEQLEAERSRCEEECESAYREGMKKVAREISLLAIDSEDDMLLPRLMRLLERDFGLEIVDRAALPIDPHRHRVIEVVESREEGPHAEVLVRGILLDGSPVRPALVRIVRPRAQARAAGQE